MTLSDSAFMQLNDNLRICRVLNGMWQVSGAHGEINHEAALATMLQYHEDGFTTWDLADHYGPAEDLIGKFRAALRKQKGEDAVEQVQALTKWVPRPIRITREVVEEAVNLSMRRMGVDTLDMLQFHWWEYRDSGYLSALNHLAYMLMEGKIRALGLTNFDTRHLKHLVDNGMRITSNQVQYSLIDRRPAVKMAKVCQEYDVHLLAYGTLAGGLLTDTYLDQPEPAGEALNTASLRKYKNMVDQWGGWALFQELLQVLRQVADRYDVSIANVAARYILDQPAVAGVIIGARLGISDHRDETTKIFEFSLTDDDLADIHAITDRGADLFQKIGDSGDEYRR